MAENNWLLQDGRSILVEFDAAAVAKAWGWFGNRSSGEGLEFDAAAAEWANHAWLRGGQMVQAAEAGGSITGTGALSSQDAVASGVGITESVGTGALAAQDSTLVASGASESSGAGSLQAGDSAVSGVGLVIELAPTSSTIVPIRRKRPAPITGTGRIVSGDSEVSGVGVVSGIPHRSREEREAEMMMIDELGRMAA